MHRYNNGVKALMQWGGDTPWEMHLVVAEARACFPNAQRR